MATLSEITQRYIKHRDLADTKEAMGNNPLFDLMVRNMVREGRMVLPSRSLGKTALVTALMEHEMDNRPSRVSGSAQQPSVEDNQQMIVCGYDVAKAGSGVFLQCQPDGSLRQIPEVHVTLEMLARGELAARATGLDCEIWAPEVLQELLIAVYPAMHAVAPIPLVTEAEDKIAALQSDIACLRRLRHDDDVRLLREAETRHMLYDRLEKSENENAILRQHLAQHGESVTFMADPPPTHTVGDMKPEPVREPKPIPAGALNPTATDRRRIGG